MNIKIIAATALIVVACFVTYKVVAEDLTDGLFDEGISHIIAKKKDGIYVNVFEADVDPQTICDIATKYSEKVVKVRNMETRKVVKCQE